MSDVPDFPEIKRPRLLPNMAAYAPSPSTADPIPCPRCNSIDTKFCYFNNYNLSQPRHFCKGCRRYWTRGGTLRDIPVGGGARKKPPKRSQRPTSSNSSSSPSSSSLTHENKPTSESVVEKPDLPFDQQLQQEQQQEQGVLNLNDNVGTEGGFMSLLNSQEQPGFLSLGGYGYGSGFVNGFHQVYGYGARAGGVNFPMEMAGGFASLYGLPVAAASSNTWQMGVVDHHGVSQRGGLVDWSGIQILESVPAGSGGGGGGGGHGGVKEDNVTDYSLGEPLS